MKPSLRHALLSSLVALLCACGGEHDHAADRSGGSPPKGDREAPTDAAAPPAEASSCAQPELPSVDNGERLAAAWAQLEPVFRERMATQLAAQNTTVLYDTQLATANLLIHAEYTRDVETVASLAALYERAFDALVVRTEALYLYATPPGASAPVRESVWPLPAPTRMWTRPAPDGFSVGAETVLDVAQFLYAVARVVRVTAEMPEPPASLARFTERALPVLLDEHYRRWLDRAPDQPGSFQTRGWGCNSGTYGHREHLENLLARRYGTAALPAPGANPPAYCNALADVDLWIIAGVVELLAAHHRAPERVPIPQATRESLRSYVALGAALIANRSVATEVRAPTGPAEGKILDPNGFDGHPGSDYAGYTDTSADCASCTKPGACTCAEFPGWVDAATKTPKRAPVPRKGVGWDISHARRLVSVFDSFRRHRAIVDGLTFTEDDARAYARQMAFAVWDGNVESPSFATYFSGANGWYRVNYANHPAFGYPPSSMTSTAALAGYGFWVELEPALFAPLRAAFATIDDPADTSSAQARRVVEALPSLAPYRVDPNACGW